MKDLLVSVVMPSFNASSWISSSIQSVQQQSIKNWDLIIIDDGSTDESRKIIVQFAERDEDGRQRPRGASCRYDDYWWCRCGQLPLHVYVLQQNPGIHFR